jgi:hypothetical protein
VAELQDLIDDRAIRDVVLRYCRGIDRMDQDLVRSCYHPDARDAHGTFEGGVDELITWVWRVLARYAVTQHFVANQLVELDGDQARSETYGVAVHRTPAGKEAGNLVTGFRFIDDFERRGEWRILRRVATTEWVRVWRPEDDWPVPAGMLTGRRDRDDPVYRQRGGA